MTSTVSQSSFGTFFVYHITRFCGAFASLSLAKGLLCLMHCCGLCVQSVKVMGQLIGLA